MIFHLDCRAAQTQSLVKLPILKRIDAIVDDCPQHTTQVEGQAGAPDNLSGRGHSCVANHHAEVKRGSKHELWVRKVSLCSRVDEHKGRHSQTKLYTLPGKLKQYREVEGHEASKESTCLIRG